MSRKIKQRYKILIIFSSACLLFFLFSVLFFKDISLLSVGAHTEGNCDGQWFHGCCDREKDYCCPCPTRTPTPTPLLPAPTSTTAPSPTLIPTSTPTLTSTPTPKLSISPTQMPTPTFEISQTPTPTIEISATPTLTPIPEATFTPTPAEGVMNLTLAKTNDRPNASAGDIVGYSLTISNITRDLTAMSLIDNLPEGFAYQSGSGAIFGGTYSSSEPAITNEGKTLTWNWNFVPALTEVKVTYKAKISDSNKAAVYTDFAWAKGLAVEDPAESNIARSDVTISQSFDYSAAVGGIVMGASTLEEGQVLGSVLPATGIDNNAYLSIAFFMIGTGLFIKRKIA